ncbi:inositol monophosphatase family protein [Streptomyces sp. NPDC004129]|uniref:inositol monophosphatase family protein n=1 Tax=Streptomyces sp. NPDC004533 TaxID=3154278 RepID=UPI0033AE3A7F
MAVSPTRTLREDPGQSGVRTIVPSIRTRTGAHDDVPEPARSHGRHRPGGGRAAGHTAARTRHLLRRTHRRLRRVGGTGGRRHAPAPGRAAAGRGLGGRVGGACRAARRGRGVGRRGRRRRDAVPPGPAAVLCEPRAGAGQRTRGGGPSRTPLGETYLAALGEGATRNGVPIGPSAKTDPAVAVVATAHPSFITRQPEATRAGRTIARRRLPRVAAVRNLGPTSADTAAGHLDAFWEFGRDDANLLPGALVACEAGALVTDAHMQRNRATAQQARLRVRHRWKAEASQWVRRRTAQLLQTASASTSCHRPGRAAAMAVTEPSGSCRAPASAWTRSGERP